jgi:hypothetical protein
MKGNIRNLVVIAIFTVIAPFILAATVTADGPYSHAIRGQYAATGSGTQLIALCGFPPGDTYIPNGAAAYVWGIQVVSIQAVYTFKSDGTGTASTTQRVVNHYSPAPQQTGLTPWAGIRTALFSFTYTVEQDSKIVITADPATFISTWISGPNQGQPPSHLSTLTLEGTISPDGKTIILNGGLPEVATLTPNLCPIPGAPNSQLISNTSSVLIWQNDNDKP